MFAFWLSAEPPQILSISIPTPLPGEVAISICLPLDTTIDTGVSVSIYCPSSGVNTPSIVWSKNSVMIMSGSHLTITKTRLGTDTITSILRINNFQFDDAGDYTCTAINRVDLATGNIRLQPC